MAKSALEELDDYGEFDDTYYDTEDEYTETIEFISEIFPDEVDDEWEITIED